jgi:hypothetical protein
MRRVLLLWTSDRLRGVGRFCATGPVGSCSSAEQFSPRGGACGAALEVGRPSCRARNSRAHGFRETTASAGDCVPSRPAPAPAAMFFSAVQAWRCGVDVTDRHPPQRRDGRRTRPGSAPRRDFRGAAEPSPGGRGSGPVSAAAPPGAASGRRLARVAAHERRSLSAIQWSAATAIPTRPARPGPADLMACVAPSYVPIVPVIASLLRVFWTCLPSPLILPSISGTRSPVPPTSLITGRPCACSDDARRCWSARLSPSTPMPPGVPDVGSA